jgi:RNA recognition motif-containing protein
MLFFPAFSHIISACLIMQTNFIFQQMKLHVQKSENGAPQNYQSKFREVTCFEEVNLSHTRASKFQPLA